MTQTNSIIVENLSHQIDGAKILKEISFKLGQGGITSIIGPNGAGKSTLLSLIARLLKIEQGTILLEGVDIKTIKNQEFAQKLAILMQQNQVNARLTIEQLAMFGRYPHHQGKPTAEDHLFVKDMLVEMQLFDIKERFIDQLSGGQLQRAFIAMILCQDSDYILLDEPLNNLDMMHGKNMMQQLRDYAKKRQKTIIMVIHDINFASVYSDFFIALKDGKIEAMGDCSSIINQDVIKQIYDIDVTVHDIEGRKIVYYYE